jgi:hypothetical protein
MKVFALIALSILAFSADAQHRQQFTLLFCEEGSECRKCVEAIPIEVIREATVVTFEATGPDGMRIKEGREDCKLLNEADWICDLGRLVLRLANDSLSVSEKRSIRVAGKVLRACVKREGSHGG